MKLKGFLSELVSACPVLPHMALGIALSWAFIACSGTAWLSDTEVDGANISIFFIAVSIAAGCALLAATRCPLKVTELLGDPRWVIGGSAVASLGCAIVIAIGPYYIQPYLAELAVRVLFCLGGIMGGVGLSVVYLKCAEIYGMLPPRRAILYVSLTHMVVAATYFVIIGSPDWAPIVGGPSFVGIAAFVLLPLAAGCLAAIPTVVRHHSWTEERRLSERVGGRSIEGAFWKLVVVVIVFATVMTAVRATVVVVSAVDATFNSTRLVMLLRMVIATVFVCAAISVKGEFFRFGKMFSVVMVLGVAVVAVLPSVGALHLIWSQVVCVVAVLFEIILWCILSFVVYQKRILPAFVFGVAYGGYQLGSCAGWALGAYGLSAIVGETYGFAVYIVLAIVVLVCAFVLFSEKEFEDLFKPTSDDEASLEELLRADLRPEPAVDEHIDVMARFNQAIEELAAECGLSSRETDVFQCLAMGYESTAISKKLQISWNTVRTHTRKVYSKLGVHSRQELIDLVEERTEGPSGSM